MFPFRLIEKSIKKFLNKKLELNQISKISETEEKEKRYVKLPYIGQISKITKIKIMKIMKKFCKNNINVNIVYNTCKIKSFFSLKDAVPKCFMSGVIYKFKCQECKSCYVGRSHKYFSDRQKEHMDTDKNSAIFKHLKNHDCRNKNDKESFSILDYAKTDYELALKEAMHIKWLNPKLNGQKKHEIIKLLI